MRDYGDTRGDYQEIFHAYWPIAVAVYVLVLGFVAFAVWRYRARRVGDHWPGGRSENTRLELGFAAVLAAIVAVLLYLTFTTMSDLEPADADMEAGAIPPGAETVDVTAAKWNWRFDYPEYGITDQGTARRTPTLTVPAETPVRFRETSVDIIHSFFIAPMRFKRDAFPGRTTTFLLRFGAGDVGFHRGWGQCAEFCGAFHAYMDFNVEVLAPDDFARWAATGGAAR